MSPTRAGRGCWTCKERKVACDRERPSCGTCTKSGRRCHGYGLKLSWPRQGDKKRAIVLQSDAITFYSDALESFVHATDSGVKLAEYERIRRIDFINVLFSDVEMHDDLHKASMHAAKFAQVAIEPSSQIHLASFLREHSKPAIPCNPQWPAFPTRATEIDLLGYFQENVAPRLTCVDNVAVQDLVFRMAFTDIQAGATGILFAIFAISSLHFADEVSAQLFKSKAIEAIQNSTSQSPDAALSLQQVIIFTLLSLYENLAQNQPRSEWEHAICGMQITGVATFALDRTYEGDDALVLDMAAYHGFVAQLSTRHNTRRSSMMKRIRSQHLAAVMLNRTHQTLIRPVLACSPEVFYTIGAIVDACWDIKEGSEIPRATIDTLEQRLRNAKQHLAGPNLPEEFSEAWFHISALAELQRLSGLIYLYRVGRRLPSLHPTVQSVVGEAFRILENMRVCDRTFPLFVVGCEAETDLQRALFLRITRQTEKECLSPAPMRMRQYMERFWALTDLDDTGVVEHPERMTAAVSARRVTPST